MRFHRNQVSWGISYSFIILYLKYQPPSFISSPIMLSPVISSLDEIYCMRVFTLTNTCSYTNDFSPIQSPQKKPPETSKSSSLNIITSSIKTIAVPFWSI